MNNRLNVVQQYQRETEWCWAAVASMVAKFLPSTRDWNQCDIVNATLASGLDCCPSPPPDGCNFSWHLDDALTTVGHPNGVSDGPMGLADLIQQIDQGFPVGVQIAFPGGGWHVILVSGYDDTSPGFETIAVNDPEKGFAPSVPYTQLVNGYRNGFWNASYLTK